MGGTLNEMRPGHVQGQPRPNREGPYIESQGNQYLQSPNPGRYDFFSIVGLGLKSGPQNLVRSFCSANPGAAKGPVASGYESYLFLVGDVPSITRRLW